MVCVCPLRVDSGLSLPALDCQPSNLLCLADRPGSARSGRASLAHFASLEIQVFFFLSQH
jgi:hypothetical protein